MLDCDSIRGGFLGIGHLAYMEGIMSIKNRIVRGILKWLWVRYPFQFKDIMLDAKCHIHRNPVKRPPYPQEEGEYPNQVK